MTEPERPLDRLIDTLVFAPIGLVLRAVEELPGLAAHGRQAVESRSDLARIVGQLTVAQGRRQAKSLFDRFQAPLRPEPPGAETGPDTPAASSAGDDRPEAAATASAATVPPDRDARLPVVAPEAAPEVTESTDVEPAVITLAAPSAADLAIPGYDTLSASQVVQRLPGLSADELEAVRAYEQAGRARKTVLLRVAQLRAAS